jgi:hypothetical protein
MRLTMTWGARPGTEKIFVEERSADVERDARLEEDYDEMRDDPAFQGRGAWLTILLIVLGIAALVLLLYWILGPR